MLVRAVALLVLITACGIPTSGNDQADPLEDAAEATASLDAYAFTWAVTYELTVPDEAGRSTVEVSGGGTVDAVTGNVDSSTRFDDSLLGTVEDLFGVLPDRVESATRVVGDDVWVRGFNTAFIDEDSAPDYDQWYHIGDRRTAFRDPFVASAVRPAEAVPVLIAPLIDAGTRSRTVDRDVVLDYGDRYPRSLFDFGLRIGGGDFEISADLGDGVVERVVIEGDDPGSGLDVFRFVLEIEPRDRVGIAAPPGSVDWSELDG